MRSFRTAFPKEFLSGYQAGVLGYRYRNIPSSRSPIDMAIYARAILDLRPATVIEIGSKAGGSALWLADLAQIYGLDATVYSIDLNPHPAVVDDRIRFLKGDVAELGTVLARHGLTEAPHPWFVSEDSAHTYRGCLAALGVLSERMQPGDLLAMEDGVLEELGLSERYDGGPNRAISEFLRTHPGRFEVVTEYCDMFGVNATYSPNGYLRRV